MSRIKDLYAIENGIEDLMPIEELAKKAAEDLEDYYNAIKKVMTEKIEGIKTRLYDESEFSEGFDDEGHKELYFENFYGLCHMIAQDYTDEYIEDQHIDLTDKAYDELRTWLGDWLADTLADYESECIHDYLDAVKEEQWALEDYNRMTLGN